MEQHPSPINPLGAKGAGEGGTIVAGSVVGNAIADALRSRNVQPNHLPLTPTRIWELAKS
jgi:carbon-monoxide dehydrogenase large subunit